MPRTPSPDHVPRARARSSATHHQLNVWWLVGTLAALLVLTPASFAWHAFQVGRIARIFLDRAAALETAAQFEEAAGYLHRYLRLHPDDGPARIRLAQVFDRSAESPRQQWRAVDLYYRALGVAAADQQPALRRRVGELLLEQGRFAEAEAEAGKLLAADPQGAEPQRLLALALYGQARTGALAAKRHTGIAVGEAFEQALRANPHDIELTATFARLYREEASLLSEPQRKQTPTDAARGQRADALLDALVAADPHSAQAVFSRYRYRLQYQLPQADEDLQAALRLAPDDVSIRLAAAERAQSDAGRIPPGPDADKQRRTRYDQAQEHYRHVLTLAPGNEAAHLGLGGLFAAQGQLDRAIEAWRAALSELGADHPLLNARLAEALLKKGRLDEAEQALSQLDAGLAAHGPRWTQASRESLQQFRDLLHATWLAKKGRPAEAIPQLIAVTARATTAGEGDGIQLQAWLLLGAQYAGLAHWDLAAAAYERAAAQPPRSAAVHVAAAQAWAAAGQFDKALTWADRALTIENAPSTQLLVAQLQLQQLLRTPAADRNRETFERILAQTQMNSDQLDQPWRLALLQADALRVRHRESGDAEAATRDALAALRSAEQKYPDEAEFQWQLALAYENLGCPTDADRARASFDRLTSDAASRAALQAELLTQRRQFDQARELLHGGLQTLSAAEHPRLRRALAKVSLQQGRPEEAYQQLRQLLELAHAPDARGMGPESRAASEGAPPSPPDLDLLRQLAELALETGQLADLDRWVDELQKREGAAGTAWRYYRAMRLLAEAKTPQEAPFLEAVGLQTQLQSERPSWPNAYLLAGLIEDARGQPAEAVAAYQQAIRLGDERLFVYQRLVESLYRLKRFAEAEQHLAKLDEFLPRSTALSTLAISVAVQRDQPERAEQLARRAVEQRPNAPLAWMWYGQTLAASKKLGEAEAALQKATKIAPHDARFWNALFSFYLRTEQRDLARQTLQTLAASAELTEEQRASVLGQGYESLADAQQAETQYQQAVRLKPQDAAAHLQLANFYLRHGNEAAEASLRRALALDPNQHPARRALAVLLATRGGEEAWQETRQLLERPGAEQDEATLDRRLQAVLWSQRPGAENLAQARKILEGLVTDPKQVVDGDRLLLAHVYVQESELLGLTLEQRQRNLQSARQQFLALVARSTPQPMHLMAYIDFLLREKQPEEAGAWIPRLDAVAPNDLRSLALRVRWLQQQGRTDEIEPLVEGRADELRKSLTAAEQQSQLYRAVGQIYALAGQYVAAERWFRRLAESAPEGYAPLAAMLAKQGRLEEAVRVCADAFKAKPSARPAITLATLLASSQTPPQEAQTAEALFAQALGNEPDNAELLTALATLRLVQQQAEAACQLYRAVLRLQPDQVLALNNLACLLADQPAHRAEALQHIDRAIELSGPQATLYDSKGMILVGLDRADEALGFLEKAAAMPEADPRFHLHLAAAYARTRNADKARAAFRQAREGRLDEQILTQTDHQLLAELQQLVE